MTKILVKNDILNVRQSVPQYTAREFDVAFGPLTNGLRGCTLTVSKGALPEDNFFVESHNQIVYIVYKTKVSNLECTCAEELLQVGPFEEEIEVLYYGSKKQCAAWKAYKEKPNLFQVGISIAATPIIIPVLAVYGEMRMLPFRYYKQQLNPFKLIGDVITAFQLQEPPLPY
jgi:hypothetical protein